MREKAPFFKTLDCGNFQEESSEGSYDPPPIVEASSIKNRLNPKKSVELLSESNFVNKLWLLVDSADLLSPEGKTKTAIRSKGMYGMSTINEIGK